MLINVYAEDHGWLFEDLKRHFARMPGVAASERPMPDADVWVALRTPEASVSPDLRRTAVCLHDLFDEEGMYHPGGSRAGVREAGALVLCHPGQRRILAASGVPLAGRRILERPLGALSIFRPRENPRRSPGSFSVGWVGKNHPRKRLPWFVEAVLGLGPAGTPVRAVLLGDGLEEAAEALRSGGVACDLHGRETHPITEYPRVYQGLDAVVITSTTEAGPLPLFEALASGVPVVSTPVGWAPWFAGPAVRLAEGPAGIAAHLEELRRSRETMFERRLEIAARVAPWTLEGWLAAVLDLAGSLVPGSSGLSSPSGNPSGLLRESGKKAELRMNPRSRDGMPSDALSTVLQSLRSVAGIEIAETDGLLPQCIAAGGRLLAFLDDEDAWDSACPGHGSGIDALIRELAPPIVFKFQFRRGASYPPGTISAGVVLPYPETPVPRDLLTRPRAIDVSARMRTGGYRGAPDGRPWMRARGDVVEQARILGREGLAVRVGKIPRERYMEELLDTRIGFNWRGFGILNIRLLEYLQWGAVIVTEPLGEELPLRDGVFLEDGVTAVFCEHPGQFAATARGLLKDPHKLEKIRRNAFELWREHLCLEATGRWYWKRLRSVLPPP